MKKVPRKSVLGHVVIVGLGMPSPPLHSGRVLITRGCSPYECYHKRAHSPGDMGVVSTWTTPG